MTDEKSELRVLQINDVWVVQFSGGLGGWQTLSDPFKTREEAEAFKERQEKSSES